MGLWDRLVRDKAQGAGEHQRRLSPWIACHVGPRSERTKGDHRLVRFAFKQDRNPLPFSCGSNAERDRRKWLETQSVLVTDIGEKVVRLDEINTGFLDRAFIDVAHFNAAIAVADHHHVTDINEEAILHHARDLVDHQ